MKLGRYTMARLYVNKVEDIEKVANIIKQIDENEAEYIPKDFITVYRGSILYTSSGKFDDLDLDEVINRCWKAGIPVCYVIKEDTNKGDK